MKASEFHKQPKHVLTQEHVKQPVTEARNPKAKKNVKQDAYVAPFGVDDPEGHVMRRIAKAKPHLMTKIQNWD